MPAFSCFGGAAPVQRGTAPPQRCSTRVQSPNQHRSRFDMSPQTRRNIEGDILAWLVIGAIFGSVMLALWGIPVWQGLHA
jgi:hypothetical protein